MTERIVHTDGKVLLEETDERRLEPGCAGKRWVAMDGREVRAITGDSVFGQNGGLLQSKDNIILKPATINPEDRLWFKERGGPWFPMFYWADELGDFAGQYAGKPRSIERTVSMMMKHPAGTRFCLSPTRPGEVVEKPEPTEEVPGFPVGARVRNGEGAEGVVLSWADAGRLRRGGVVPWRMTYEGNSKFSAGRVYLDKPSWLTLIDPPAVEEKAEADQKVAAQTPVENATPKTSEAAPSAVARAPGFDGNPRRPMRRKVDPLPERQPVEDPLVDDPCELADLTCAPATPREWFLAIWKED